MSRALRTINAILEMDMIKIGSGIHEPLPKLFYELRYNENHDEKGRFTFGKGGSASSGKGVDKAPKLGYTERVEAAKNMTPFEVEVVSSYLHTNFPELEINGERHYKSVGDCKYVFKVRGHGSYEFLEKEPIDRSDDDD